MEKILGFFKFKLLAFALLSTGLVRASEVTSSQECILVQNAKIYLPKHAGKDNVTRANLGHQIANGRHVVISIRQFFDADQGPDSQSFSKTTIEFLKFPLGLESNGESHLNARQTYHTEGDPAFLEKGSYAWSDKPLEKIHVIRDASGFRLRFSGKVSGKQALSGKNEELKLDLDCRISIVKLGALSYWQGRIGTPWQAFYPVPL